jgi:hypothetical protein
VVVEEHCSHRGAFAAAGSWFGRAAHAARVRVRGVHRFAVTGVCVVVMCFGLYANMTPNTLGFQPADVVHVDGSR